MMKNPILVTGATGTVGRELVTQLLERNDRVRAMVHDMSKADGLAEKGVEIVMGDLNNPEDVRLAVDQVEKIYLLTPVTPNMVEMTKIMREEAERAGVRKIVKQSLLGCDSAPFTTFGKLHHDCEKVLKASGMGQTFLRPNQFMQNFINYYGDGIRRKDVIAKPCGDGRTSFIDARDIAAAATVVIEGNWHDGKTYSITGPESIGNADVARILSDVTGRPISYVDVPVEEYRRQMSTWGMGDFMMNGMMDVLEAERSNRGSAVTRDFQHLTGRQPNSFARFARDNAVSFAKL